VSSGRGELRSSSARLTKVSGQHLVQSGSIVSLRQKTHVPWLRSGRLLGRFLKKGVAATRVGRDYSPSTLGFCLVLGVGPCFYIFLHPQSEMRGSFLHITEVTTVAVASKEVFPSFLSVWTSHQPFSKKNASGRIPRSVEDADTSVSRAVPERVVAIIRTSGGHKYEITLLVGQGRAGAGGTRACPKNPKTAQKYA